MNSGGAITYRASHARFVLVAFNRADEGEDHGNRVAE